jgi:hypothetical protein
MDILANGLVWGQLRWGGFLRSRGALEVAGARWDLKKRGFWSLTLTLTRPGARREDFVVARRKKLEFGIVDEAAGRSFTWQRRGAFS